MALDHREGVEAHAREGLGEGLEVVGEDLRLVGALVVDLLHLVAPHHAVLEGEETREEACRGGLGRRPLRVVPAELV